jgi:serine/threonine protein kinase
MELQIGQQIGNYHLVEIIAQGAYANVYKAEHNTLSNRLVAIKILHTAFVDPGGEHDVLSQEAHILERLKHPHILAVVDFGMYQNWPYIVKEYAPNGSLRDYLRSLRGRPMPINEIIYVLSQVGDGLQFAHDNKVVHCDLKPENILFDANTVLISDFDIARVLESANSYQRGIGGTPSYMAPEQFQGKVGSESDQYALGCMAYEMVTGKRPFEGDSAEAIRYNHFHLNPTPPSQLRPELPRPIEQAILRAMEKKYSQRFPDVASFMAAINPVQQPAAFNDWSQVVPQSGPKLILYQYGKGKAAEDESIFYEDTVSMYAEVTDVEIKPVRHRTPKAKAMAEDTGLARSGSRSEAVAKKTTPKATIPKKTTAVKKTVSKVTPVKKTAVVKKTAATKDVTSKVAVARKATTAKKALPKVTASGKATTAKDVPAKVTKKDSSVKEAASQAASSRQMFPDPVSKAPIFGIAPAFRPAVVEKAPPSRPGRSGKQSDSDASAAMPEKKVSTRTRKATSTEEKPAKARKR